VATIYSKLPSDNHLPPPLNRAIIKVITGSGCRMKPRRVTALLPILLFCVAVVSADDQKTPPAHISKQTRMDLIRAHQLVETGHRHDAYHMVVNFTTPALQRSVLVNLKKSLSLWLQYRDAVAKACNIKKP